MIRFLTNLNLHSKVTRKRNYWCFLPICIPLNVKNVLAYDYPLQFKQVRKQSNFVTDLC